MNRKYTEVLEYTKRVLDDMEERIKLQWEDDDCTQCYRQALEEAVEEFDEVYRRLQKAVQVDQIEANMNSRVLPAPGQKRLL